MMPGFKDWLAEQLSAPLSQLPPAGAGDLSDNQSNSDYAFGVRSKNFGPSMPERKSGLNPRRKYGIGKRAQK